MKKTSSRHNRLQPVLFLIGFGCMAAGVWGLVQWGLGLQSLNPRSFIRDDVALYSEFHLNGSTLETLQDLFQNPQILDDISPLVEEYFAMNIEKDIAPWIGSKISLSVYPDREFVATLAYRQKSGARNFIEKLKMPDENFEEKKVEPLTILTPEYSSKTAISFYRNTLIIASSEDALTRGLEKDQTLTHNEHFWNVTSDLPRRNLVMVYFDSAQAAELALTSQNLRDKKPLIDTIAQSLRAGGFAIREEDNALNFQTKILTTEGITNPELTSNLANQTIPELARYAPKDVLFFMNGNDLYRKYQHTREFLSQMNPQFALIFDGIMRAESKRLFGENFDLEKDFLMNMHGQYAVIVDFTQDEYPQLALSFLTQFGGADQEQSLSRLHDAIHFAQSQFSTQTRTVELPDGSTREELISVPPESVPIQKIEENSQTYFSAQNPVSEKQFSYGFLDRYFVFSSHQKSFESLIASHADPTQSVSYNKDFRESVLFRFSPSESYGFMNLAKVTEYLDFRNNMQPAPSPILNQITSFLKRNARNLTFARKSLPKEIFVTLTLFPR